MSDKTKLLVGLLAVFMLAAQTTTSYSPTGAAPGSLIFFSGDGEKKDTTIELLPETQRLLDSLRLIKTQVDSLKDSCTRGLVVIKQQQKAILKRQKEIDTMISEKQIKKALKYNEWLLRN